MDKLKLEELLVVNGGKMDAREIACDNVDPLAANRAEAAMRNSRAKLPNVMLPFCEGTEVGDDQDGGGNPGDSEEDTGSSSV